MLLLWGCAVPVQDRAGVLQVVQVRSRALNSRDLPAYLAIISPSYSDRGKDYAALRQDLEQAFRDYDELSYRSEEQQLEISGSRATVTGRYHMRIVVRGKELVLDGRERLVLAREAGGWKIIAGL